MGELSQLLLVNQFNADFVKGLILEKVYEKDGKQYINIHNHRLDFSGCFEFLGFTKTGNKLKLAETNTDFKPFFAKLVLDEFNHVDGRSFFVIKIITTGYNYIERVEFEL